MYEFAWRSPQFNGLLGACHALEIAFVFDTLGSRTELVWGTYPPQPLADTMHAAWVAFATNGDPGWPKYELSRRVTMRFDTASEVVDDPRSVERELWAGVRWGSVVVVSWPGSKLGVRAHSSECRARNIRQQGRERPSGPARAGPLYSPVRTHQSMLPGTMRGSA
jgi:hypothetical protein